VTLVADPNDPTDKLAESRREERADRDADVADELAQIERLAEALSEGPDEDLPAPR
jgi:hypothetical protein